MTRVLMAAGFFSPHKGGSERYAEAMAKHLSKTCAVTILTTNTDDAPPRETRTVEVVRLPAIVLFSGYPCILPTPSFFALMAHVARQKYDVVVSHTRFFQTTLLAFLFSLLFDIPLLHIEHGSAHVIVKDRVARWVAHTVDHLWGRLLGLTARKVGAVSGASADFARHIGIRGPIRIIPNFVDTTLFSKRRGNPTRLTVTYVGRLVSQKGLDDLLAVWPEVLERIDARLLIVGEGEERKEYEYCDDVFFLGQKESQDVADILAETDVFVNPSLSEGLPSSVLEACACGLPVLATDVGGTSEVIEEEFLFAPRDRLALREKLCDLLSDEEKRKSVGARNMRVAQERFSLDNVAREFDEFIRI